MPAESFKLRLPPKLRAALDADCETTNQSLNTLIVNKLQQSFRERDPLDEALLDPSLRSLAHVVVMAFCRAGRAAARDSGIPEQPDACWMQDAACYRHAAAEAAHTLDVTTDRATISLERGRK